MFEFLFIIGMLAWLVELLVEFLSTLQVFPTLLVAVIAIPIVAFLDYQHSLAHHLLASVTCSREPIPPEAFRWSLARPRWKKQIWICAVSLPAGWFPIFWFPARLSFSTSSTIGWLCGSIAIVSTAVLFSKLILYFQVAQWFDKMTPRLAGWFWSTMYRISDNSDFLPPKKEPAGMKLERMAAD